MATSSSPLDQFSHLIATSLRALQQDAQRKEIERAMSTEPLSEVQSYELDLALRQLAYETAPKIAAAFVPNLKSKLQPELPPVPPPEGEPSPADSPEDIRQPEEPRPAEPELELVPEAAPEPEPVSIPEPEPKSLKPENQPPSAYQPGQPMNNPSLAAVVRDIGQCGNGFNFSKVAGRFKCSAGGHFASDAQAEAEY